MIHIPTSDDFARSLMTAALAAHMSGLDGDSECEPYIVARIHIPLAVAKAIVNHPRFSELVDALAVERFCRICGATDHTLYQDGCYWVEPHLCSACVPRVPLVIQEHIAEVTDGN